MPRPRHWTVFVNLSTGEVKREPVDEQVDSD